MTIGYSAYALVSHCQTAFFCFSLWWQEKGLMTYSQYCLMQRHISFILSVELLSINTYLIV